MNRGELTEYINGQYACISEEPWSTCEHIVFRHNGNKKWFAIIMDVVADKLGLDSDKVIDIVNLKCDPIMIGSLLQKRGFAPAYHMNKEHWVSAIIGQADDEDVKMLIDISFDLTK